MHRAWDRIAEVLVRLISAPAAADLDEFPNR
jgi:hypothetical protein